MTLVKTLVGEVSGVEQEYPVERLLSAGDTFFDNTGTGLTATTVQAALLEIKELIGMPNYQNVARDVLGRARVSSTNPVFAAHASLSSNSNLFVQALTGGGTVTHNINHACYDLSVGTTSGDEVIQQTKRYFLYNAVSSNIVSISGVIGEAKANVRKRIGFFDSLDGFFLEQDGTSALNFAYRTSTSGSAVDTKIARTSWNLDKLDGTGPSGLTLDLSKHQLWFYEFAWRGAAANRFGFYIDGTVVYCHQVQAGNTLSLPISRTAVLPIRCEITNTGTAASATTMKIVCRTFETESDGAFLRANARYSRSNGTAGKSAASGTFTPILGVRLKQNNPFDATKINRIPVNIKNLNILTQSKISIIQVILNPATMTGASWTSVNSTSAMEYDSSSTAFTGGTIIKEFPVNAGGFLNESLDTLEELILGQAISGGSQDVLLIAAAGVGGATTINCAIDWEEFQ